MLCSYVQNSEQPDQHTATEVFMHAPRGPNIACRACTMRGLCDVMCDLCGVTRWMFPGSALPLHRMNGSSNSSITTTHVRSHVLSQPTTTHVHSQQASDWAPMQKFRHRAPTRRANRRQTCKKKKRVCDVCIFRPRFHFACHHWWLGYVGRVRYEAAQSGREEEIAHVYSTLVSLLWHDIVRHNAVTRSLPPPFIPQVWRQVSRGSLAGGETLGNQKRSRNRS